MQIKLRLYYFIVFLATISCANSSEFYISDITIPIRSGETDKALSLITKNKVAIQTPNNLFELFKTAIRSDKKVIFDHLTSFKYDYNFTNKNGRNLVFIAAAQEKTYYLEFLLSKNLNLDHKEEDRDTAFSVAAATYNLPAMKLLIQHGAKDLDSHANNSSVPLNVAVAHKDVELVQMMLEQGADPNHQYELYYKKFPLQIAVEKNSPEIVKLLLKHKADPNKLTCYGESPLYLANQGYEFTAKNAEQNKQKIIAVLKKYGGVIPEKPPRSRSTSGSFRRPGC